LLPDLEGGGVIVREDVRGVVVLIGEEKTVPVLGSKLVCFFDSPVRPAVGRVSRNSAPSAARILRRSTDTPSLIARRIG